MSKADYTRLIYMKRGDCLSRIPVEWRLSESVTSRAHRNASISAFDLFEETNVLTVKERDITEKHDATSLLEMIASGQISSLEVTTAFCKRAAIAHQLVCRLTQHPADTFWLVVRSSFQANVLSRPTV